MKECFDQYIDLATIIIALIWTVGASYRTIKTRFSGLRTALVPLVYIGPVLLLCCMLTHLAEISFHAIDSGFTGKFSMRFHLYSLYLMPLVLGNAGIFLYLGSRKFLSAAAPSRRYMLLPAAIIALILFPLLWLTPLSFIMFAALGISMGASFLVHKKEQPDADQEMYTLREATTA